MPITEASIQPVQSASRRTRNLSAKERERKVQRLMWTFHVEGIKITREQAEEAVERSLSKPLPEI